MLKVLKYLKKSWVSVVAIILLLCLQAYTDLALPDYTSKIVNVGIQQGGIEDAVPEAIRSSQMENLLVFTNEDGQILNYYTLLERGSMDEKEYEEQVEEYPVLENKAIYVLKEDISEEERNTLSEQMAKPLMMLASLENEETQEQLKEQMLSQMENVPQEQKMLIEQMSLMDILKTMPESQLEQILSKVEEQLNGMSGSILEQAAITEIKAEYQAMGRDTDKIQNDYIFITGLQMLGIALISMTAAVSIMLLSSRVAAKLGETLRDKVFRKVLSFSTKEFREFSTASLA